MPACLDNISRVILVETGKRHVRVGSQQSQRAMIVCFAGGVPCLRSGLDLSKGSERKSARRVERLTHRWSKEAHSDAKRLLLPLRADKRPVHQQLITHFAVSLQNMARRVFRVSFDRN